MTDDMRRIINILVDWLMLTGQDADLIFDCQTCISIASAEDEHSQRLVFALALALGLEESAVTEYLRSAEGRIRLAELLERCRKVFINS